MRILITGPTSFSGAFFIEALAKAGHQVTTTFTQPIEAYQGVRALRAKKSLEYSTAYFGVRFGDDAFLDVIRNGDIDIFCHHGAWTENYQSIDYDFQAAYQNNTRSMKEVCQTLAKANCQAIVISSSIFEGGILQRPAFSPHGLIKQLTSETTSFYGRHFGMHVSRFVIPNPFGALDNSKLIDYLCREWYANRIPRVRTPLYIRDNIHIELMAKGFVHWIEKVSKGHDASLFAPSGYISTMSDFVELVATKMRMRLKLECAYELNTQTDFSQPMKLVNDTSLRKIFPNWNADSAWDALAEHQRYLQRLR